MGDISAGEIFADGETVDAERLNNDVNAAVIQSNLITGRSEVAAASGDFLLLSDTSNSGALIKAELGDAVAVIGGDGSTAVGTAAFRIVSANSSDATATHALSCADTRIPASVTGIRKGAGVASNDTAAVSSDYAQAPTTAAFTAGATTLNAALNTNFVLPFPATTTACTINVHNFPNGGTVRIYTTQGGTGASTCSYATFSDAGTTGLTEERPGGAGEVTNSTNALDLIVMERLNSKVIITFRNAMA